MLVMVKKYDVVNTS